MLLIIGIALLVIGLAWVAVNQYRRWAHRRKMLGFCERSRDARIYVRDPQTGTMHNFEELMATRMGC